MPRTKSTEENQISDGPEKLDASITVRLHSERKKNLSALGRKIGFSDNSAFLNAVWNVLENKTPDQIQQFLDENGFSESLNITDAGAMTLPMLAEVPCGPWLPALQRADDFHMSGDMAAEWEAREDDILIRANGQSMEGAHIPNNALVLMRPLPNRRYPRDGEVTMVEVEDEDGNFHGTLKRWYGTSQNVVLKDGNGEEFPLPPKAKFIRPIATFRGCIYAQTPK